VEGRALIVQNLTKNATLATNAVEAQNFNERRIGLLNTPELPAGGGMWINPCQSIHTHGMQYAIDVVFLDQLGQVTQVHPKVRPGHHGIRSFNAASVLELPVGTIGSTETAVGDQLKFTRVVQPARGVSKTVDMIALAVACLFAFALLVSK
jgi:uncharacterized membrane protein (UPF0127 family)